MPERVRYVTGMATRSVARALPPTPIPDMKVSEKTLYTMASLEGEGREGKLCGDDTNVKDFISMQ